MPSGLQLLRTAMVGTAWAAWVSGVFGVLTDEVTVWVMFHSSGMQKQKGLRLTTRFAHAVSRSPCLGSLLASIRLLASGSAEALRLPCEVCPASGWSGDHAVFVPGYSGGPATDSHRVPYLDADRRADSLKAPKRRSIRPKGL